MIRSEYEPAAEGESGVDEQGAEQEAQHRGEGFFQRHDQHVVRAEEAQVAQHSEPDEEIARTQQDAANIPQRVRYVLPIIKKNSKKIEKNRIFF